MEKLIKQKMDALESYVIEQVESLKRYLMSLEDIKYNDLKLIANLSSLIIDNKKRLDYLKAILKESDEKEKTNNTQNPQSKIL